MTRRRLLWRIFGVSLLATVLLIVAVDVLASRAIRAFHRDQTRNDLEVRARLLTREVADGLRRPAPADWDRLCKDLGRQTNTRLTLIGPDGVVWGDSHQDPRLMDNHGWRPEVRPVLMGQPVGSDVRRSDTLDADMMYVAVPVLGLDGRCAAAVRASLPLTAVNAVTRRITFWVLLSGAVAAALAGLMGVLLTARIVRSIRLLRAGADRFATGDFAGKVRVYDSRELGHLADALNRMADQLDDKIRTITRQRNEHQAILSGMAEGVVAVDGQGRIIELNTAAADLLGVTADQARGRRVEELARNTELARVLEEVLDRGQPTAEGEIVLHGGPDRFLRGQAAALRDADGRQRGAVLVFNDITRMRRLETLRRDFVANVSHELKTPVTSIKGFVETLADGAIDEPAQARRFLTIIARQADRLNAIIDDLLMLSRLEQGPEPAQVERTPTLVRTVLETAADDCRNRAAERNIAIEIACPPDLNAAVNPPLIEQALVNLLDNAIKYSEPGGRVRLEAAVEAGQTVVRVIDRGCGIAPEHLPRLFERFYRVDRARSRTLGGTGLGLAIVKHIAQVHGGTVTVHSAQGRGSTFALRLPRDRPSDTEGTADG